jgi:hypothetical protein
MRNTIYSLVTILVLLAQLMTPSLALADGETATPVASETATEEPTTTETEAPPTEVVAPSETETPPAELTATETEALATETTLEVSETPTLEATAATLEPTPAETEITPEPALLQEIIEQLPENTNIIVLNDNNQPEPLASQAAAQIAATADPIWCPASTTVPTPGANGCSPADTSLESLLTWIRNNASGAGTIWIESSYDSDINDFYATEFLIDGNAYTSIRDYALTIQGGWSGISGDDTIDGHSMFHIPLSVINWKNNVTVSSITVEGTTQDGMTITTSGSVDVVDSDFRGNRGNGLVVESQGNVRLINVTAGDRVYPSYYDPTIIYYPYYDATIGGSNGKNGAYIRTMNDLEIYSGHFSNNNLNGIDAQASNIGIYNLARFNANGQNGASLSADNNVYIDVPDFLRNNNDGLFVSSAKYVDIYNGYFLFNGQDGLHAISDGSSGISVRGAGWFNGNGAYGINAELKVPGQILIDCVTFENNFLGDYLLGGAGLSGSIKNVYDCSGNLIETQTFGPLNYLLPITSTSATGEVQLVMNCANKNELIPPAQLPNGDMVEIFCPVKGKATIRRVASTATPQEIPAGYSYVSGFSVKLEKMKYDRERQIPVVEDVKYIEEGGFLRASFLMPANQADARYDIIYWDESTQQWLVLPYNIETNPSETIKLNANDPDDPRAIIRGIKYNVSMVTDNLQRDRLDIMVNFPGIFVLVQK